MRVDFYQVDVFTIALFKGNPAGVVLNADALTAAEMQSIAREVNNPETAFVLKPQDDSHDIRIRYFTPNIEVSGCGHATLAACYVWARQRGFKKRLINLKLPHGILPVELLGDGKNKRVFMTQSLPKFKSVLSGSGKNHLLNALNLTPKDLIRTPVQVVDSEDSKILIPLKDKNLLNNLTPDFGRLVDVSVQFNCNGFHVFTLDNQNDITTTYARTFSPAIGVNEDPVAGSGNGHLGAYLVKYQLIKHNNRCFQFVSRQGEDINRSGFAHVTVKIEDGIPTAVKVGGDVRLVFATTIEL
ncbi:PhzF family phenazine biosynthesis isomerase [Fulvivirgaceae bacterium BMA12]|uniref:PhzF family phenazine biosynthesis isomerase n=1 Tax=Agaribacillus aureus TaxID=3051825 RepID=A0ABT8LJ42_9BACT|nr:PhzF family phenazine biosynthesis isomerase [Fulvivirgaceae bacterium BMA12]